MSKHTLTIFSFLFIMLLGIELSLRFAGLIDFPLYEANNEIGYIPKPSQNGLFLRKNSWKFNSKSMGASEFMPTDATDTLLIGDSVVLGGNPYKEEDKLGNQLQKSLKQPVWPISAGSWSLRNELIYLKVHPEVVKDIDQFIFILNSEDFGPASSWACEEKHPRTQPLLASVYIMKKYIYSWDSCDVMPPELRVPKGNWNEDLREFISMNKVRGKKIFFFLYPNKFEMLVNTSLFEKLEVYAKDLINASDNSASVYSVGRDSRWKSEFYKDEIHPTIEGTKVLADIISSPEDKIRLIK